MILKKRHFTHLRENMVELQNIISPQLSKISLRKSSPLCAFASSILFIYVCGISVYLWSSNFCRFRNLGEETPIALSFTSWNIEQRGRFVVIKNYIRAAIQPKKKQTMTFAAAATFPELTNMPDICGRWKGPMSVSVYAPGSDFKISLRKILNLRLTNACIHQNVSWHMYFDAEFSPPWHKLRSPEEEAGLATQSSSSYELWAKGTFKSHGNLPFPANVGRNVAIRESPTTLVLMSDLHYYPSTEIVPRFLELMKYQGPSNNRAYVLPVLKMTGYGKPPETKSELVQMTADGNIVLPSNTLDCSKCNIFPHARKWLESRSPDNTLSVYYVSNDKEEFESWLPYYISTRDVPLFDEDQIREGKYDRKLQVNHTFIHYNKKNSFFFKLLLNIITKTWYERVFLHYISYYSPMNIKNKI